MEGRQLRGERIVAINMYNTLFSEENSFNIYLFVCLRFGTTCFGWKLEEEVALSSNFILHAIRY